ncbi:MAG: hypothetical protein H7287_02275 [Thermoleophilia bacterium]|nr:hypothetical protein [Thermoleophilia bacterium]
MMLASATRQLRLTHHLQTLDARPRIVGGDDRAPAAPRASGALAGAQLVAEGSGSAPLLDFPKVAAGRSMAIVKGSRVGALSPTGTATVDRMDGNMATFSLNAVAIGQSAKFQMTIERIDATRVRITSKNATTGASQMVLGTIVSSKPNYAQFQAADGSGKTTVYQNPAGQIIIDTNVPGYGAAHLILQ